VEKDRATALVGGSELLRAGRADVFRIRERTRRRRVLRLVVVLGAIDGYLWYRYATQNPIRLPSLPPEFVWYLPILFLILAIGLMALLPFFSGRSPHLLVRPEQIDVGLSEVRGLDAQVDEVLRTLDVFLGYATFREELGGNPRRGVLFEGPPGTGKTFLAKAMAKQAGVPFLFISAPAFQSMWFGMTAARIRSFFRALRKAARKELATYSANAPVRARSSVGETSERRAPATSSAVTARSASTCGSIHRSRPSGSLAASGYSIRLSSPMPSVQSSPSAS